MARKPTMIRVLWIDARFDASDDGQTGVPQSSIGYVVQRDRKTIKIAMTQTQWESGDEPSDVLTIPRAYVQEIRAIQLAPPPKPKRKPDPKPQEAP